ncbi:putative HTH-type transcriptional regulator YtdP [Paenibacillus marchantiophytorum]|uniref:HTH-type transcriptional regulator YtdP n=1 Tax=Paenibacillus marchantiophytorum TaxID=1619310 RepID=A0ABQ1FI34_9BACL|nr:helix-turn-helix domain-containing protein [Paenibacillus marchantiophytorum]GGA14653.1 putative HTH-type transcriptional regulator YtdP [Paenibacillus marchantiophytorum]
MRALTQLWAQRKKPNRLLLVYFFSYILVILLPVIGIAFFSYRLALFTAVDEISNSHINSLRHMVATFDDTLKRVNSLTVTIGLDGRLNSYSADHDNRYLLNEFQDVLKQAVATDRKIQSLQLFFESGQVMISSDMLIHAYQGTKAERWVEAIRATDEDHLWLPPRLIRNYDGREESIVTYISKVPVSYHDKVGYLAIHLYEERLQEQLTQMQNIAHMNTYIVTREGQFITSYKQADIDSMVTQMNMKQVAEQSGEGFYTDKTNRPHILVAYSKPLWNGWRLVSQTPLTNIYEKLSYIGYLTFGLCILLSIIGIAISYWLSRKMYDPIKQLMERTKVYMDELSINNLLHSNNELSLVSDVLRTAVGEKKQLDQHLRKQAPAMLERFGLSLLHQRLTDYTDIQEQIDLHRLEMSMRGYVVMVVEMDYAAELAQRFSSKDLNLYQYAIVNIISELMESQTHYRFVMTNVAEHQQAVIINVFDMMEADELRELAQVMQSVISDVLKISVTIGIGSVYPDIIQSHKSYQEALQVLKMKLLHGANSVLLFEMLDKEQAYYSLLQTEKQLINNLKAGNTAEILAILEKMKLEITQKQLQSESVYMAYNRVLEASVEALLEHNGHPHQLFGPDIVLYRELAKRETIDHIHQWMSSIVEKIALYIQDQDNKNNKTVEKVVAYIHEHHQTDLSIEMIATGVGFNSSYLSRMFKQHTGRTILEYLTLIRMEASKKLLMDTNINLYDISTAVGYNNVNSYIRFFKKLEGITPGEYRKKNRL